MQKNEKTNVMRVLEGQKLTYQAHTYPSDTALSGVEVAQYLQQDPTHVFKTLVTVGASRKNYVFVIPVGEELSLKKAAQAVGEKSIEMIVGDVEEVQTLVRVDDDGLHVGDGTNTGEVLIDESSVNVVMNGQKYSQFASNYVQFGNYQLRQSADGGLVFKLKEG